MSSIQDSISFSVSPFIARTNKAINFYKNNIDKTLQKGLMLCLATGPSVGWPKSGSTEIVPLPLLTDSQLISPIGFKRFKNMKIVVSDTAGTHTVGGVMWRAITGNNDTELFTNAKAELARWIYVEAEVATSELNSGNTYYRQIGLYSDLQITNTVFSSNPSKQVFLPAEIERSGSIYNGILEVFQNMRPTRRSNDNTETFSWVLEF